MLYFAVSTLDVGGGIQVTGSHNPSDYNGFKMLLKGRSVFGMEIQDLGRRAAEIISGRASTSMRLIIGAIAMSASELMTLSP